MKNKGFTLIELLAVIVILAIIALIATPIILGIIDDAREGARARSAEMVHTGVKYAYTTSLYGNTTGAELGKVTLENIKDNLDIDNVDLDENVKIDSDAKTLTIETDDAVTCVVSEDANGFAIICGKTPADGEDVKDDYIKSTRITGKVPATGTDGE